MLFNEGKMKEYCGVLGVSSSDYSFSVANMIYSGLMAIQHRGQLYSGISTTNCDGKIYSFKDRGLVSQVLNPHKLKAFSGNVGIGHVCNGNPRVKSVEDAQPYHFISNNTEFSIAFNGGITNYDEIRNYLVHMGKIFISTSEIELIATLVETMSKLSSNMIETLKKCMKILKGAYSFIILSNEGDLYVVRDPNGYKPLSYGTYETENRSLFIIASESCAIDAIGGKLEGDIRPGEIFHIEPQNKVKKFKFNLNGKYNICQYEYVYFARPDSVIEGISVADVRFRLGINLARQDLNFNPENSIVIPVPDSGRSAAMGYAWESKIPYQEGLMKNRYLWQLKSDPNDRLNPIKPIVNGKNLILIDDSILSGITMKKIIQMLKKAGANTIHVRIGCPPIINNCQILNIFTNKKLLIAYQKKKLINRDFIDEIRKYIKADSLKFQTIDNLIKSIGLNQTSICYACMQEKNTEDEKKENKKIELII